MEWNPTVSRYVSSGLTHSRAEISNAGTLRCQSSNVGKNCSNIFWYFIAFWFSWKNARQVCLLKLIASKSSETFRITIYWRKYLVVSWSYASNNYSYQGPPYTTYFRRWIIWGSTCSRRNILSSPVHSGLYMAWF